MAQELTRRLSLLGISADTKYNVGEFYPTLAGAIDGIISRFYAHILSFPEGKQALEKMDIQNSLIPRQRAHWLKLFSCKFDDDYYRSAVRIGQVHYEQRVSPYLYLAGYNFFSCELIRLAAQSHRDAVSLSNLLTSISRVVTLDMDLALSAYTREHWVRQNSSPPRGGEIS